MFYDRCERLYFANERFFCPSLQRGPDLGSQHRLW